MFMSDDRDIIDPSCGDGGIIDPFSDDFGRLIDLLSELPGGRPSPAIISRWVTQGIRGRRLPAVKFRGAWCSTRSAIRRWIVETQMTASPAEGGDDEVEIELQRRGYATA
jgi:hypothetical protein